MNIFWLKVDEILKFFKHEILNRLGWRGAKSCVYQIENKWITSHETENDLITLTWMIFRFGL